MTIIEAIKQYLLTCPIFTNLENEIGIDYQKEQPDSFSINSTPENRLIYEDVTGVKHKQFTFTITSRAYTATDLNRIENLNLLDNFSDWIEEQRENENFPNLSGVNKSPIAEDIQILSNAYLYSNDPQIQNGIYQVQAKLYYYEGGN